MSERQKDKDTLDQHLNMKPQRRGLQATGYGIMKAEEAPLKGAVGRASLDTRRTYIKEISDLHNRISWVRCTASCIHECPEKRLDIHNGLDTLIKKNKESPVSAATSRKEVLALSSHIKEELTDFLKQHGMYAAFQDHSAAAEAYRQAQILKSGQIIDGPA